MTILRALAVVAGLEVEEDGFAGPTREGILSLQVHAALATTVRAQRRGEEERERERRPDQREIDRPDRPFTAQERPFYKNESLGLDHETFYVANCN